MATFGTPFPGASDAGNALRCAQAMIGSIDELNRERKHRGEPPIRISLGLHYGQVVLGDIGLNRLEFAVIGTTVNAASRLESLTREFGCAMIASDDLVQRARAEATSSDADFAHLVAQPPQPIRGLEQPVGIWTCGQRFATDQALMLFVMTKVGSMMRKVVRDRCESLPFKLAGGASLRAVPPFAGLW